MQKEHGEDCIQNLEGIELLVSLLEDMADKYFEDGDLKFVVESAVRVLNAQKQRIDLLEKSNESLQNLADLAVQLIF